jgi:hypothetical protein
VAQSEDEGDDSELKAQLGEMAAGIGLRKRWHDGGRALGVHRRRALGRRWRGATGTQHSGRGCKVEAGSRRDELSVARLTEEWSG